MQSKCSLWFLAQLLITEVIVRYFHYNFIFFFTQITSQEELFYLLLNAFFQPFFRKKMYKIVPINKCILSIKHVSINPNYHQMSMGDSTRQKTTFTPLCSWLHLEPGGCAVQLRKILTLFRTHWNTMQPLIPPGFWAWCC